MKTSKAIIHIGGSQLQLPSLQWAREAGLYVVLSDMNPGCPGRALADRFEKISGTDVEALLQLAHKINKEHKLVGAYCSNDFGLPGVAAISETFSLPGPTDVAVQNALDKTRAREIWEREGLPIPKGWQVRTLEELTSLVADINLPIIIKPPDSSGSRGVSSAWSETEIIKSFENARGYSDVVLVEELIKGHHIDVNGLFLDKAFHPCGTLDRFFCDPPYHYPVWGCQPSSLDEPEESQVYQLVERAARVLGIDEGPVKGDVIFTEEGPILLEIAPRFHGDTVTTFTTPQALNCNPIRAWFTHLVNSGEDPKEYLNMESQQHAGWMAIFPDIQGKLIALDVPDKNEIPVNVSDIFIREKPGSLINTVKDNTSVYGFIWGTAPNRDELLQSFKITRSKIRFLVDKIDHNESMDSL